ncbi:MAG TPA: DUF2924 domain-containing protein [Gemmataceae bacterium]|jgi:hypothetical protein
MEQTLNPDIAALPRLTTSELRARYAEVFGDQPPTWNRVWMLRRIAWRLQALAEGGLSERARRRAEELANDADLRLNPPKTKDAEAPAERTTIKPLPTKADDRLPPPATILTRPYKGQIVQVQVLTSGFAYQGQVYPSLSAVAKAVTGSHCNGFLFFRNALNNQQENR